MYSHIHNTVTEVETLTQSKMNVFLQENALAHTNAEHTGART